jgi:hypothetical protein
MNNVWKLKTGMTREEVEAFYIAAIDTLRDFGYTESEAREMVQESFKESIK